MKKRIIISLLATMLITVPAFAADIDSMTLEELKTAYRELEAKYNELAGIEDVQDTSEATEVVNIPFWKDGIYKVGVDIPAGEYMLISYDDPAYFCVTADSNGDDIIFNEMFKYNSIITINDNEYVEFSDCAAYPFESWSEMNTVDITQPNFMAKVGIHIPAGEYKVCSLEGERGYYVIYPDSRQNDIIANDVFEGQNYVTISDGQYFSLSDALIQ